MARVTHRNILADGSLKLLLFLLQTYRYLISPWLGNHCRFYPSCSLYAKEALLQYGVLKGLQMTLWRLLRCHPFHPGGYDPVVSVCSSKSPATSRIIQPIMAKSELKKPKNQEN